MVRRDQGEASAWQLDADDLDAARIVNVVEVQEGKEARIRPAAPQIVLQVDALQTAAQQLRRESAHPLVEVAKHQFRAADVLVRDDRREPFGLMAPLEDCRAEVNV